METCPFQLLESIMMLLNPVREIICRYTNNTSRFQILRISNIPHRFLERVVPPKSSIIFETLQGAQLQVHTSTMMNFTLSDLILCDHPVQVPDLSMNRTQYTNTLDGFVRSDYGALDAPQSCLILPS